MEHIIKSQVHHTFDKLSGETRRYIVENNVIDEIIDECHDPPGVVQLRLKVLELPSDMRQKIYENGPRAIPERFLTNLDDSDHKYIRENHVLEHIAQACGESEEIIRYRLKFLNLSKTHRKIACSQRAQIFARQFLNEQHL